VSNLLFLVPAFRGVSQAKWCWNPGWVLVPVLGFPEVEQVLGPLFVPCSLLVVWFPKVNSLGPCVSLCVKEIRSCGLSVCVIIVLACVYLCLILIILTCVCLCVLIYYSWPSCPCVSIIFWPVSSVCSY